LEYGKDTEIFNPEQVGISVIKEIGKEAVKVNSRTGNILVSSQRKVDNKLAEFKGQYPSKEVWYGIDNEMVTFFMEQEVISLPNWLARNNG